MSATQNIPQKFQLDSLIHQDSYLVNNTLIKWTGDMANVYSPILTPDANGKLSKTFGYGSQFDRKRSFAGIRCSLCCL